MEDYENTWTITIKADSIEGAMAAVRKCLEAWNAGREPHSGIRDASTSHGRMSYSVQKGDVLEALADRIVGLDPYLNSDEVCEIAALESAIEMGLAATTRAEKFLEIVPKGKYDANKRKYRDLL